jgi:signal transduction histidine kinase
MDNWKDKYVELNKNFNNFQEEYKQFIHFAAHDLDSPLRKLSTFVDRLSSAHGNVQDENIKTYIVRIENCVEDMRSVIDSLHHLSIANSEKIIIRNCDLAKIVGRVLNNLEEEIKEKNVLIEAVDLPVIMGNENQYLLLFKNIFDNAIKFSGKIPSLIVKVGSGILTKEQKVSMHLPEKKDYYKIVISDNGPGFTQENAQDIFKPFVRLHGKTEIPGSGLGLAICKKIVENHHGLIYAEGSENSGARFVLILPQTQD